jgi:hypothetical protein
VKCEKQAKSHAAIVSERDKYKINENEAKMKKKRNLHNSFLVYLIDEKIKTKPCRF